jgi:hypothetical protein
VRLRLRARLGHVDRRLAVGVVMAVGVGAVMEPWRLAGSGGGGLLRREGRTRRGV